MPTSPEATLRRDVSPEDLEPYRRELTGYCYRMLGSSFEAEDAVQETMVRAWTHLSSFEGRSSLRSWLYRIATNACLDMVRGRQRRARPMDMGPSSTADLANLGPMLPEATWVTPIATDQVSDATDPAEVAAARESIRLAFVNALQHLPARQRAVLILCSVLRWQATEVAELLEVSVASVNSALQRARATMALHAATPVTDVSDEQEAVLARYVDAFERYDIEALVDLLHEDAVQSMPPFAMWLTGPTEITRWMVGPGQGCQGSRLVRIAANGEPAFAQYRPDGAGGYAPWAIIVIETAGDQVVSMSSFLDTRLFASFGLPDHLPS